MKIALFIVGGLFVLIGLLWTLQGLDVLPGSAMSGHRKWIVIGAGVAAFGVVLEFFGARLQKR